MYIWNKYCSYDLFLSKKYLKKSQLHKIIFNYNNIHNITLFTVFSIK